MQSSVAVHILCVEIGAMLHQILRDLNRAVAASNMKGAAHGRVPGVDVGAAVYEPLRSARVSTRGSNVQRSSSEIVSEIQVMRSEEREATEDIQLRGRKGGAGPYTPLTLPTT